jgi:hypothetical protein
MRQTVRKARRRIITSFQKDLEYPIRHTKGCTRPLLPYNRVDVKENKRTTSKREMAVDGDGSNRRTTMAGNRNRIREDRIAMTSS